MDSIAFVHTPISPSIEINGDLDDDHPHIKRLAATSGSSDICYSSDAECTSDDDRAFSNELPQEQSLLMTEMSDARCDVALLEIEGRLTLSEEIESLARVELARLERCARDHVYRGRALYFRHFLATATHRGYGPSVWPRHAFLPPASFNAPSEYQPERFPDRSCLRNPAAGPADPDRRIQITDVVTVQAGNEYLESEDDLASASAQWRSISLYAPVRHMVMMSLKARFGGDASDRDGWVTAAETYHWLDDIFCGVKDAYQQLHNEEAVEWSAMMEEFRVSRLSNGMWWSRLGNLIWY